MAEPRSGPERFWARRHVGLAFGVALAVSLVAHVGPLMGLSAPSRLMVRDVEGEAAIPIDVLSHEQEPPPTPEPPSSPIAAPKDDEGPRHALRGPIAAARLDAGALRNAGERDAATPEGGSPDASSETGDAMAPDPHSLAGVVAAVAPKVVNVVLVINVRAIRSNPVGANLGFLLRALPQWSDFMTGTAIDPVRDGDWFMVSGASLVNTGKDVVLIHYSATDAAIDRAVAIVSHKYARGGAVELGVSGVKGALIYADHAERVILRPAPHLLAVVAPSDAQYTARQLAGARVTPPILPDEAVFLRLEKPQRPFPELPDSISQLRLRVVPRPDFGADVLVEGDTPNPEAAARAAEVVERFIRRHNDALTSLFTHGLLDRAEVRAEGSLVKVRVAATRDQIETLLALVSGFLGVAPPASDGSPQGRGSLGGAPPLR